MLRPIRHRAPRAGWASLLPPGVAVRQGRMSKAMVGAVSLLAMQAGSPTEHGPPAATAGTGPSLVGASSTGPVARPWERAWGPMQAGLLSPGWLPQPPQPHPAGVLHGLVLRPPARAPDAGDPPLPAAVLVPATEPATEQQAPGQPVRVRAGVLSVAGPLALGDERLADLSRLAATAGFLGLSGQTQYAASLGFAAAVGRTGVWTWNAGGPVPLVVHNATALTPEPEVWADMRELFPFVARAVHVVTPHAAFVVEESPLLDAAQGGFAPPAAVGRDPGTVRALEEAARFALSVPACLGRDGLLLGTIHQGARVVDLGRLRIAPDRREALRALLEAVSWRWQELVVERVARDEFNMPADVVAAARRFADIRPAGGEPERFVMDGSAPPGVLPSEVAEVGRRLALDPSGTAPIQLERFVVYPNGLSRYHADDERTVLVRALNPRQRVFLPDRFARTYRPGDDLLRTVPVVFEERTDLPGFTEVSASETCQVHGKCPVSSTRQAPDGRLLLPPNGTRLGGGYMPDNAPPVPFAAATAHGEPFVTGPVDAHIVEAGVLLTGYAGDSRWLVTRARRRAARTRDLTGLLLPVRAVEHDPTETRLVLDAPGIEFPGAADGYRRRQALNWQSQAFRPRFTEVVRSLAHLIVRTRLGPGALDWATLPVVRTDGKSYVTYGNASVAVLGLGAPEGDPVAGLNRLVALVFSREQGDAIHAVAAEYGLRGVRQWFGDTAFAALDAVTEVVPPAPGPLLDALHRGAAAAQGGRGTRRALLVSGRATNESPTETDDLLAMAQFLEAWGFTEVRMLGYEEDRFAYLPYAGGLATTDAVLSEVSRLVALAQPGDHTFLLLASHGGASGPFGWLADEPGRLMLPDHRLADALSGLRGTLTGVVAACNSGAFLDNIAATLEGRAAVIAAAPSGTLASAYSTPGPASVADVLTAYRQAVDEMRQDSALWEGLSGSPDELNAWVNANLVWRIWNAQPRAYGSTMPMAQYTGGAWSSLLPSGAVPFQLAENGPSGRERRTEDAPLA